MEIRSIGVNVGNGFERHSHGAEGVYEIHYFLEGSGQFVNAGRSYPVREGCLFLSSPEDEHEAAGNRPSPSMIIYNVSFLLDEGEGQLLRSLRAFFAESAARQTGMGFGLLFEDIRRKALSGNYFLKRSADHRFLSFLYDILSGQAASSHSRGQAYIDEALRAMQSAIAGGFSLDGLVGRLGIDKSYFIRIFKKAMGAPPVRYFLELKMDAARSSLSDARRSVREVALELGYSDEFYFSRLFKTYTGLSPSAYRESIVKP